MARKCTKILLFSVLTTVCFIYIYWIATTTSTKALEGNKYNIPQEALRQYTDTPHQELVRLHENDQQNKTNSLEESKVTRKSLKEELSTDMQRCSLAMGMSQETVNQSLDKINRIAEKAAFFLDTLWEVVPKPQDYLQDYKNPCFYSNTSIKESVSKYYVSALPAYQNLKLPSDKVDWLYEELYTKQRPQPTLHCLPYFLVPGFMKSGTTTLHSALSHHPHITQPERKEPQWWYKLPLDKGKQYLKVFIGRYLSNFQQPSKQISRNNGHVTYDASQTLTLNVYDSSFHIDHEDYCALPAVISRVLPNAKIILVMRDPVPRVYSQYLQMHAGGKPEHWPSEMRRNPAQYFHKHIIKALADWDKCIHERSLFECTNSVRTNYEELKVRLGSSIYHLHISKWMQFWPKENFLLFKMEDMSANPVLTMKKITDFLELEPILDDRAWDWINKKRQNQRKVNTVMLEVDTNLLNVFYEPFNKELDSLFNIIWTYND